MPIRSVDVHTIKQFISKSDSWEFFASSFHISAFAAEEEEELIDGFLLLQFSLLVIIILYSSLSSLFSILCSFIKENTQDSLIPFRI